MVISMIEIYAKFCIHSLVDYTIVITSAAHHMKTAGAKEMLVAKGRGGKTNNLVHFCYIYRAGVDTKEEQGQEKKCIVLAFWQFGAPILPIHDEADH